MGALSVGSGSRFNLQSSKDQNDVVVAEEIQGLIRVYKDGHVERFPVIAEVACTSAPEPDVLSKDVTIDKSTGVWARFYVPRGCGQRSNLALLVYFHGGGFCIGSAAWSSYHEFLAKLSSRAGCLIMSVNYRLAPEYRLPAAYDDGVCAIKWLRQLAIASGGGGSDHQGWWRNSCDFTKVYLAGDSAGASLAHNVAVRLSCATEANSLKPLCLKGLILIQPFFGGEARTGSERSMALPAKSALNLEASDAYWRLALPLGANRDHPWCNPLAKSSPVLEELSIPPTLVCISEMDLLKDRNLAYCMAMRRSGKNVNHVIYTGVGHAFQILDSSTLSHTRTQEMLSHIKSFIAL